MTNAQIQRIKQSITETQNLLSKELSYLPKNQKQEMVLFYKNHLIKLYAMIK